MIPFNDGCLFVVCLSDWYPGVDFRDPGKARNPGKDNVPLHHMTDVGSLGLIVPYDGEHSLLWLTKPNGEHKVAHLFLRDQNVKRRGHILRVERDVRAHVTARMSGTRGTDYNDASNSFTPGREYTFTQVVQIRLWFRILDFCMHVDYQDPRDNRWDNLRDIFGEVL